MLSSEKIAAAEDIIATWAEVWSAHDVDRIVALHTPDALFEDVPRAAGFRGEAELRKYVEGVFIGYPDVSFQVTSCFGNDQFGSAEWVMRATHLGDRPGLPATGKRVEVRGASVFEFSHGKIHRCSDYWDMGTVLKQLGLGIQK